MISEQRVRELIALGNENRNLDYKGAFSWATATNEEKCEIVKDVLAFANARDGGIILVGVNDKTGVIEGLTDEQFTSFDQTKFNDFVHKHTDPRHTSRVHRLNIDGKKIVVIDVPEFTDVPILCKSSVQKGNSKANQFILRQAGLYKRTDKATSELIEDADEMRELLNRGLLRRQDELLRAFKQILLPQTAQLPSEPGVEFKNEIQEGEKFFRELDDGKLIQNPHWFLLMQPETYAKRRIPKLIDLQNRVQSSAVSLRGWSFPIVGRVWNSSWSNFGAGSQSFYSSPGRSPEGIRAYQSGLILWCSGVAEDVSQAYHDKNVLSFIRVIYSTTEWMLFAKRYFESLLSLEESIRFKVSLTGTLGRSLISADPLVDLFENYQAQVPSIEVEEQITLSDLRSDAEAVGRRIARRIFELFNWNDPGEEMLHVWQQKLINKQF
jgi:hypothetical protein